ncbi:MAG: cyclase family protein [Methanomicrobiaceae archaeon]|nr:cyclase family protein [Methanomicrobiaceae archaeon]
MIINLTHPMKRSSPLYTGTPEISIKSHKSIENGDSSNTSIISFSSHSGTHIDSPFHFCKDGKSVSGIIPYGWSLEPAYCIGVEKGQGECIDVNDINGLPDEIRDAKALIIKTGFGSFRDNEPEIYTTKNPWVHPDVPDCIRDEFPELLLFGLDTISISTPEHRFEGLEYHRNFLCSSRPVIILEDINLCNIKGGTEKIKLSIYPCFYDEIDGTPVFVFAEK